MVLEWFEKDNFRRTVQEVLIVALKERNLDFHELDPVVQATLLGEAMQVGVQQSLETFTSTKAAIEETNAAQKFQEMLLKEIYRERGKTLPKDEQV